MTDIAISTKTSQQAGSCNACDRFITAEGTTPHEVLEIHLRTISFRLCDVCRATLVGLLARPGNKQNDL